MAIQSVSTLARRFLAAGKLATVGVLASLAQGQSATPTFSGPFPENAAPAPAVTARAAVAEGRRFDIGAVVVTGDRDPVFALPNWTQYENNALYEPMSEADIEAFRAQVLKDLQDAGYLFATVSVFRDSLANGFLKLRVHVGEKGEVTVTGNRWHTAEAVLQGLEWETGAEFNYRTLYEELFGLNSQPNMRVTPQLKPRVVGDRRVVDANFEVRDRFPLHFAWTLSNTGSTETSDWRSRLSAQFTNLVDIGGVASVDWVTDPFEIDQLNAVSLSAYLPGSKWWGLGVFGGFSDSEVEDVVTNATGGIDISGEGFYTGFNFIFKLKETKRYSIDLSLGWLFQEITSTTTARSGSDQFELVSNRVTNSMPRVTIGYQDRMFDKMGGRNSVSLAFTGNFGGRLGASDFLFRNDGNTEEYKNTFVMARFQWARLQKLWGRADGTRIWTLFARADAQLTGDTLPSSLHYSIGGLDSVRGYRERARSGDWGYTASVELRTPLWDNFLPGFKQDSKFLADNPDHWSLHRVQGVIFADAGSVFYNDGPYLEQDVQNLWSFGFGVRLGLTPYSQMRLDLGIPLKELPEDDDSVRGHVSVQLQY